MIDNIRDWVMARDTPLSLVWHGMGELIFDDNLHHYRVEQAGVLHVALLEKWSDATSRWGWNTLYYTKKLPESKERLMQLVEVCNYLTTKIESELDDASIGPLDLGALMDIFHT